MGYKCNAGFAPRAKWISRMLKLHAPKPLASKKVWQYFKEVEQEARKYEN
jgi:hypothetical protein